MRILLMTWACDLKDISEPEISAIWVKELSKDHEVTVFSVSRPDRFGCVNKQFPDLNVIEWKDIWVPSFLERFRAIVKPGYFFYYIKARFFLRKFLKTNKFDVIHHLSPFAWRYPSPATGLGVPLVKGPVAGGLETPTCFSKHVTKGFHPFMFLRKTDKVRMKFDPLLRNSYSKIDHLLMAAPYMEKYLRPLPIKQHSIEIEHGLEDESKLYPKKQQAALDDHVNFLYVGRVIRTKGLRYAIRAFSMMNSNNNVTFTIIGDGEDLLACKNEAIKLGVSDKINFLGWLKKDILIQHYKESDVFIFPSFREPTGGVLLEAMTYGLPCITCSYGGPDYVIDQSCGIKIHPNSEDQFISEINQAMNLLSINSNLRSNMGKAAISRVTDHFLWREKRIRMKKIYESIIN